MKEYKRIDMDSYARKQHFLYFRDMGYPYTGTTVNVDITGFPEKMKANRLPFFLTFLYHVVGAANAVPELRQRIMNGGIVEYPHCDASYIVAQENGTYCYCRVRTDMPFGEFLPYAAAKQEEAKRADAINNGEDELSLLYISTAPWLSYTSLVQPVPFPPDSNPRITWGRYFEQEGKTFIPVTLLCHHALADGLHIARFYDHLNQRLAEA